MSTTDPTRKMIEGTIDSLIKYCRSNNWAGWDPYDALNSKIFEKLKFLHSRWPRLILTQGMKRSPINFRKILAVPKTHNPKGIALFISALVKLSGKDGRYNDDIQYLIDLLLSLRSPGEADFCWGYNFDWQQRIYLVPKFSPNIICTTFAGNALMDAYEYFGDEQLLQIAKSSGNFIINELHRKTDSGESYFMYTTASESQVHNANLLGSAYMARLYSFLNDLKYKDLAIETANYTVDRQNPDGSWPYGVLHYQGWIDNFHTCYNLLALKTVADCIPTDIYENNLERGLSFYRRNFFEGPLPKYYDNKIYPIDIHSISLSIITLVTFKEDHENLPGLLFSIYQWSARNMRSSQGFYYFQKHPFLTNRIPYMRWSQAWMTFAIATLISSQ